MIGVGRVGHLFSKDPKIEGIYSHTGGYAACADTNLVAICDIDREALAEAGDDLGIPRRMRFADVGSMLKRAKPEIVSVATPDDSHPAIMQQCLLTESVKGILCEKPVAHTAGMVQGLVALASELRKPVAVHYTRRYSQAHRDLRKLIRSGYLGQPVSVTGIYRRGLYHTGTHWLDLARYLLGEFTAVQGIATAYGGDPDPEVSMLFEMRGRGGLQIQGSLIASPTLSYVVFEMDIFGTDRRVRLVDSGQSFELYIPGESKHWTDMVTLRRSHSRACPRGGIGDVLLNAVADLAQCIREPGRVPVCSIADAWAVTQVADAALATAGLSLAPFEPEPDEDGVEVPDAGDVNSGHGGGSVH